MEALSPPKHDRATAKGIVQFMTPNTLSANVWKRETTTLENYYANSFYHLLILCIIYLRHQLSSALFLIPLNLHCEFHHIY